MQLVRGAMDFHIEGLRQDGLPVSLASIRE